MLLLQKSVLLQERKLPSPKSWTEAVLITLTSLGQGNICCYIFKITGYRSHTLSSWVEDIRWAHKEHKFKNISYYDNLRQYFLLMPGGLLCGLVQVTLFLWEHTAHEETVLPKHYQLIASSELLPCVSWIHSSNCICQAGTDCSSGKLCLKARQMHQYQPAATQSKDTLPK